jgi:hypothetical protein
VIGAVNIARPHLRLSEARMRELASKLLVAARDLSVAMVTSAPGPRRSGAPDNYLASAP